MNNSETQHGAALFTALIMLIALTLVALASLGTSLLEMRMSGNEELAMSAYQSAEAGAEVATNDALKAQVFVIARGSKGATTCYNTDTKYNWPSSCDYTIPTSAVPPPVNSNAHHLKITQTIDRGPPPASGKYATSAKHFSAASFEAESIYDKSGLGQGKSAVVQGLMQFLPGPPTGTSPSEPVESN